MSRLDMSVQRFNTALESLDAAAAPLAGVRAAATDSKTKLAALIDERERLLARIAELEEENRALAGISEEVEDRLDGAIGDIRAALGR